MCIRDSTWDQPGYAQAEAADVIRLMAPEIEKAQALGITAPVSYTHLTLPTSDLV